MRLPLLFLSLLSLPIVAQQPTVTERVEVRLIEVDAIVTDRQGNPVTGLTAGDFELFENGKRQTITNFSEYRETSETTRAPEAKPASVAIARPVPRTILLLLDRLPLLGPARAKLFADLRSLTDRVVRNGDRAQVLVWKDLKGIETLTPMTTDRAAILHAVGEAERSPFAQAQSGPSIDDLTVFTGEAADVAAGRGAELDTESEIALSKRNAARQALAVMRRKTAAIQRILSSLGRLDGKNVMIYVSDKFPLIAGREFSIGARAESDAPEATLQPFSTREMLDAIIRTANANDVVMYSLRPELPSTSDQFGSLDEESLRFEQIGPATEAKRDQIVLQNELDALSLVSEATGGTVAIGPAGVEQAIERIASDLDSYYALAYQTHSDGTDRERRVEVRPKNRQYVVRTRSTLVDRSDKTRALDQLVARLFERGPAGDIDFQVTTGPGKPQGRGRTLIPVELSIPAGQLRFEAEGNELAAKFSVLSVAGADIGQTTRTTTDSRRVVVPPGAGGEGAVTYGFDLLADSKPTTVSIAVFDEKSGLAGTKSISIEGGEASTETVPDSPVTGDAWREILSRAQRERKAILIFFRPRRCNECVQFARETLNHPTIQRRLPGLIFSTLPTNTGEAAKLWSSKEPGFAFFDRSGLLRARWTGVPDTTTFGAILDGVIAVAPHFERAVQLAESVGPYDGEVEAAIGLAKIGRTADARAALERAIDQGNAATRMAAIVTRAQLDVSEGKSAQALAQLDGIVAGAATPDMAGAAWLAIGIVHRAAGAIDKASHAFTTASEIVEPGSLVHASAQAALAALKRAPAGATGLIRILPIDQSIVSGRHTVRTNVASAAIARVSFSLDGSEISQVTRPPFSATLDFGTSPERRAIRVVAFDQAGAEVGRDELVVNDAGETFWLRLVEPREGPAGGAVSVKMNVRVPAARRVQRVMVFWNDAQRAVLKTPPWQSTINIPAEQMGVLHVVAELDDGRTSEDAVLLNASGPVEHSNVQLVEIPITAFSRSGSPFAMTGNAITIREGDHQNHIESVSTGADTQLTVGLLIDASASMQKTLPDVIEAATRFLQTVLGERDRAFIVTFDTRAHLVQPATSNLELLRSQLMTIRPEGLTALYDAMALGLLQFEGIKGRRAMVVFTDGLDRASRYGADDVGELARRVNIPIHLIAKEPVISGMTSSASPKPQSLQSAANERKSAPVFAWPKVVAADADWTRSFDELTRVTKSTGGTAHRLDSLTKLPAVYSQIEAALRAQVLVMMRTDPGTKENEWRRIQVEIAGQNLEVHAPEGYYAPW